MHKAGHVTVRFLYIGGLLMKSIICLLMAMLLLTMAGCVQQPAAVSEAVSGTASLNGQGEAGHQQVLSTLSIPYEKADFLNPYKLNTQLNKTIMPLLYDSLYKLDPDYSATPVIAKSSTIAGSECRVYIRSDLKFSDQTAVTPRDVVYSYELAAASPAYKSGLSSIVAAVEAPQEQAVVFTLKSPDALANNLLTFPIIKQGTAEQDVPTGSGRFVYTKNALLPSAASALPTGNVRAIRLVEVSSRDSFAAAIRTGVIDFMFTPLTDAQDYSIGSSSSLVSTNSLVYLGINSNKPYLSDSRVRRGLYMSLDRKDIADRSFMSKARPTFTPFNPLVGWLPDVEFFDSDSGTLARTLFSEAGLSYDNITKYYQDQNKKFELSLLVNADNSIKVSTANRIKNHFEASGIGISVRELPYSEYTAAVARGEFDLYLGEIKLKDNMDISVLITPGFTTSAGVAADQALLENYGNFRGDIKNIDSFMVAFIDVMPFIPIAYHDGIVAYPRNFPAGVIATEQDIFYNIDKW